MNFQTTALGGILHIKMFFLDGLIVSIFQIH